MSRSLTAIPGNTLRLDGGAMFGSVPRALWSRWAAADERARIPLASRALLVRDGERNLLFEAGVGASFEPRLRDRFGVVEGRHVLLDSLAAHGLTDADIDVVVLSHLHFDHAGGLLEAWRPDAEPGLLFPRATFLVGAAHWERARRPHLRDRASFLPRLNVLLEASGRLVRADGPTSDVLGAGYRLRYVDGHTPGMMLTEIAMPDGPVVFAGDLIPGVPWVHLPVTMGYDRCPEQVIDEKQALLGELDGRGRLFLTHDPGVAMAGVRRDDRDRFTVVDPVEAPVGVTR